ncbi:unnamed protein product [Adineta ricciae]|uniref:Uncharacterized protein n=2 Tax=Adineta ricciae TaxID=249248 RepID=A0A816F7R8_ADIRI|nr:unnamed protein product [Adineta ricciae]
MQFRHQEFYRISSDGRIRSVLIGSNVGFVDLGIGAHRGGREYSIDLLYDKYIFSTNFKRCGDQAIFKTENIQMKLFETLKFDLNKDGRLENDESRFNNGNIESSLKRLIKEIDIRVLSHI